jgi:hypothetical protein
MGKTMGGKKREDKRKVTRIDEGTGKREMWTGERYVC